MGRSESQLDRALDLSFGNLLADRALYLGDAELVSRRRLLSSPSADDSLWTRSLACVHASPDEIERFVAAERRNLDWARLELPEGGRHSIGLSLERSLCVEGDGEAAFDRAAGAELVVSRPNGVRTATVVEEGEGRLRLSPGSLDEAGLIVISDDDEDLTVEVYDLDGVQLSRRVLPVSAGR